MPTYSSLELSSAKSIATNNKHKLFRRYRPNFNVRQKRTFDQIKRQTEIIKTRRLALKGNTKNLEQFSAFIKNK
jgi:hypothetical protein